MKWPEFVVTGWRRSTFWHFAIGNWYTLEAATCGRPSSASSDLSISSQYSLRRAQFWIIWIVHHILDRVRPGCVGFSACQSTWGTNNRNINDCGWAASGERWCTDLVPFSHSLLSDCWKFVPIHTDYFDCYRNILLLLLPLKTKRSTENPTYFENFKNICCIT